MDLAVTILREIWLTTVEMAPWLLLGLLIAGLIHLFLPEGFIRRYLGGGRFGAVLRAVLIGVPMPLCSCGVVPAALGLKKDGASNGASMGFLISTPQTGVDSILVSATFLGWPFAIFKVLSAFISGLLGGVVVNATESGGSPTEPEPEKAAPCCCGNNSGKTAQRSWGDIFKFGFVELLGDFYRWLAFGIVAAGIIAALVPQDSLKEYWWAQGVSGLLAMLIISLPMYICATASVPLAASLVVAGMSPGAALVLLMAGPATNVATIAIIGRSFGRKNAVIYLVTVAVVSILAGWFFDSVLSAAPPATEHMHNALPMALQITAAVILVSAMLVLAARDVAKWMRRSRRTADSQDSCCHTDPGQEDDAKLHQIGTSGHR